MFNLIFLCFLDGKIKQEQIQVSKGDIADERYDEVSQEKTS